MNYEFLLDGKNGVSLYQFLVYIWAQLGNLVHAGPLAYMVFVVMKPVQDQPINSTVHYEQSASNLTDLYIFNSAVKEWNMTGNREWIPRVLLSIQQIGSCIGKFAIGPVCDKYGRKMGVYLSLSAICLCSVALSFSPNWQVMAVLMFGYGLAIGGYLVSKGVLYSELIVQRWRLFAFFVGPPLGYLFVDVVAWLMADNWRDFSLLILLPAPLFLIMTVYPIQESPKWYLESNRPRKAAQMFRRIAKVNRRNLIVKETELDVPKTDRKGTWKDLLGDKQLRIYVVILSYVIFCTALSYYGMIYNLGNVAGNVFENFAIIYTFRMVVNSLLIYVETFGKKIGRRVVLQTGLIPTFLCTAMSSLVLFFPEACLNYPWLYRVPAVVSVGCSGFLWTATYVYIAELWPTMVRGKGAGICSFFGSMGSIMSPLLGVMYSAWRPLPYLTLTILLAVAICGAHRYLPETKGKPLPEFEVKKSHEINDSDQTGPTQVGAIVTVN